MHIVLNSKQVNKERVTTMPSKRATNYIIIFNFAMSLILFFLSQLVLSILNGTIVGNIGFYIDYGFPSTFPDAVPTSHAPLPNYPLFAVIFTLVGNAILILQLRRENKQR
jgi:hypothetical protein